MATAGEAVSRRHQQFLPAYVAMVIFGILGMHALVQHCPAPAHAVAAAAATTEVVAHHAGDHLTAVAAPSMSPVTASEQFTGGAGGTIGNMLMLCAAMLLGAGAVLGLVLSRRLRRPMAVTLLRLNSWRPALPVANTGPPPTLAFAVIRC